MMWANSIEGLTANIVFLIAIAAVNISSSLKPQIEPQDLVMLTGFLLFDLSMQNCPFLSSLSVHFASIDISVVSMFWVISSSAL